MTGFGEFAYAIEFREAIQRLITSEIDKQRPDYEYATVDSVDFVAKTAQVKMPGESTPVVVRIGAVAPIEAGQAVKIEGNRGDRRITDVLTGPLRLNTDQEVELIRSRLISTASVTLSSTDHAFQIGLDAGANIAFDPDAIQARNNGVASDLYLNPLGGNVNTGGPLIAPKLLRGSAPIESGTNWTQRSQSAAFTTVTATWTDTYLSVQDDAHQDDGSISATPTFISNADGLYLGQFLLSFDTNATGVRGSRAITQGGSVIGYDVTDPNSSSTPNSIFVAHLPGGGYYVKFQRYQSSGITLGSPSVPASIRFVQIA